MKIFRDQKYKNYTHYLCNKDLRFISLHPFLRLQGGRPNYRSKPVVHAMWKDIPEPLMLAAQATAIFGITFLFFTFLLRILDKMTDQSVNGVDKEHAERSIILRAGPARSKHMQNNNSHESHGSDTPSGSGQALRRKKALKSCTTRSGREPSSSSGSQSPTRVKDGSRLSPTRLRPPKPGSTVLGSHGYKHVDGQESRTEDIGDSARGQSPVKRTLCSQEKHHVTNPMTTSATISSEMRFLASDESLSCAISSRRATKLAGLAPSPHCLDLAALLKMRCDVSGCDYALLWRQCEKKRAFVVVGAFVTPMYRADAKAEGKTGTFAEASHDVALLLDGQSAVVRSFQSRRWQQTMFINVDNCDFFYRREQAVHHGIKSIGFTPCPQLQGVVEFGSRSAGARGFEAHGAEYRAPEDQRPRVDLSASDSILYRRDIPIRFDDLKGSPQWANYAKTHFPKHWAQLEDDEDRNEIPSLQHDQRQQVKPKHTQDRRRPTHVSKRRSADLQLRNFVASQSMSALDGDDKNEDDDKARDQHAQYRGKTSEAQMRKCSSQMSKSSSQVVTSEGQEDVTCDSLGDVTYSQCIHDVRDLSQMSKSASMLALNGKDYESLQQQCQHMEQLHQQFQDIEQKAKKVAVQKGKGLTISCGEVWEDRDRGMMELSPAKRRLIWGTLNDTEFNTNV